MKYVFILAVILYSCDSNERPSDPVVREARVAAVFTNADSTKSLHVGLRIIDRVPVLVDSAKRIWKEKIDTLWGRPVIVPMKDSTGKALLDSLGKPVLNPNPVYFKVSKDSVNWRIEGKDIDSLLKMN